MINVTRIRLYPNKSQRAQLAKEFGAARWVWNDALSETQRHYRETGKGLGYNALSRRLTGLKRRNPWLLDVTAQALQQSLRNLSHAFELFFLKKARYPRFKKKCGDQSVLYPQKVRIVGNKIRIPKCGLMKCVIHRPISGKIKTVALVANGSGQYHACIMADDGLQDPLVSTEGKVIGLDLGVTNIAVTSDGSKFENPRHLRRASKRLKKIQRNLTKKKRGSNNREKARSRLAKAHLKLSNVRKDYLHKLSKRLVDENQVIVVEDLYLFSMRKIRSLSRSLDDASLGRLLVFLEYKCRRAGKAFVKVGRFYPSTKACNCCGAVNREITLKQRVWTCPKCAAVHDRDVNAAKNIRDEGMRLIAAGSAVTACRGDLSRRKKLASRSAGPVESGNTSRKAG